MGMLRNFVDLVARAQIAALGSTYALLAGAIAQPFSASLFTTAQGLKFPQVQNPSVDANTLDDYEEGTWLPTFTGAVIVGTPTYYGNYIKMGQHVRFELYIISTTSFSSPDRTSCYFTLPFAPSSLLSRGSGILKAVNAGSNVDYGQNTLATNDKAYLPAIPATSDILVVGEFFTGA